MSTESISCPNLLEPRFRPTSGVPTIRESLTITAFMRTDPNGESSSRSDDWMRIALPVRGR